MKYLLIILLCISTHLLHAKQADSARIYFEISSSTLSKAAKQTLDSLLYNDIITKGRKVGLIGYADNTGTDTINNPLSLERAKAVATYLQYMGIDTTDIELVTGKGAIKRNTQQSQLTDRRVDIIPSGFKVNAPKETKTATVSSDIASLQKLTTIEKGQAVSLNNIVFAAGTPEILEESYPTLQALTRTLKENPKIKIRIEGHVCCNGSYENSKEMMKNRNRNSLAEQARIEQTLSDRRAYAVQKYLTSHGIDQSRLSCLGFGTKVPLYEADGKTMNVHKNRRVEIRIMDK